MRFNSKRQVTLQCDVMYAARAQTYVTTVKKKRKKERTKSVLSVSFNSVSEKKREEKEKEEERAPIHWITRR